jgi:putative membrane protein
LLAAASRSDGPRPVFVPCNDDLHTSSCFRSELTEGPAVFYHSVKKFLQSWLINTLAVLAAVYIVRGIHYQQWLDLLVASLLLGILNAVLRPLLMFLTLPLLIFTLGLFMLFINAMLLYFVSFLLKPHFYVDSFGSAFWGALIISLVSIILNTLTGTGTSRVHFERRRRPPDQGGGGPVIDV